MIKVLVTGGSAGLGKAFVEKFAGEYNHFVYFTYYKSIESSETIEKSFSNTKKFFCDFRNSDSVTELCKLLEEQQIDIVINNAISGFRLKHFHKFSVDDVNAGFMHNVAPTINILLNAVKVFRTRKSGKIINVLSSYVHGTPPKGCSLYVAEKKYIESISESIANENNKFNIQVNCISPSFMKTEMNSDVDYRVIEEMERGAPQKSLLEPNDVAEIVFSLVDGKSIYLNGQNLNLNAGR